MTKPLKHHHLLISAKVNNPPKAGDQPYLDSWVKELIDGIGMKLLDGPHIKYVSVPGNRGLTMVCIIETSHIAMHVWDEPDPAMIELDVYSCATLDPKVVIEYLQLFEPVEIKAKFLDREKGFKEMHTIEWKKEHTL